VTTPLSQALSQVALCLRLPLMVIRVSAMTAPTAGLMATIRRILAMPLLSRVIVLQLHRFPPVRTPTRTPMSKIAHLLTLVILLNEATVRPRQSCPVTHLGVPMSRVPDPPRRCLLNLLTSAILTKSDCYTADLETSAACLC